MSKWMRGSLKGGGQKKSEGLVIGENGEIPHVIQKGDVWFDFGSLES